MNVAKQSAITVTRAWVSDFVVGLNMCPFAAPMLKNERLRIIGDTSTDLAAIESMLLSECQRLAEADPNDHGTTLIVYEQVAEQFFEYLDLVDRLNRLMNKQGWSGIFQLATFHPEYCFEGVSSDDLSHFTNRSPWPMVHLIREDDISRAVDTYADIALVAEKNVETLRKMGALKLRKLLLPFLREQYLPQCEE